MNPFECYQAKADLGSHAAIIVDKLSILKRDTSVNSSDPSWASVEGAAITEADCEDKISAIIDDDDVDDIEEKLTRIDIDEIALRKSSLGSISFGKKGKFII